MRTSALSLLALCAILIASCASQAPQPCNCSGTQCSCCFNVNSTSTSCTTIQYYPQNGGVVFSVDLNGQNIGIDYNMNYKNQSCLSTYWTFKSYCIEILSGYPKNTQATFKITLVPGPFDVQIIVSQIFSYSVVSNSAAISAPKSRDLDVMPPRDLKLSAAMDPKYCQSNCPSSGNGCQCSDDIKTCFCCSSAENICFAPEFMYSVGNNVWVEPYLAYGGYEVYYLGSNIFIGLSTSYQSKGTQALCMTNPIKGADTTLCVTLTQTSASGLEFVGYSSVVFGPSGKQIFLGNLTVNQ